MDVDAAELLKPLIVLLASRWLPVGWSFSVRHRLIAGFLCGARTCERRTYMRFCIEDDGIVGAFAGSGR